jgi:uncharacterized membrane protein
LSGKPAPAATPDSQAGSERDQVNQNIGAVTDFYVREGQGISHPQRLLERVSTFVGKPVYLGFILLFVILWILVNLALGRLGLASFDRAPFPWLQGIISLGALLTATVVLTRQSRLDRLAEQRAHLDLKVTLLTEQKAAKLIDLLEELRRDLPNVKDRHDPASASLQQPMDPDAVLAALDEAKGPLTNAVVAKAGLEGTTP